VKDRILDPGPDLNSKSIGRHRSPLDPALYLRERNFARSRGVVGERRKSAIVGSSERFKRDQLSGFKHVIAHFLGTLYPGIDRVRDANEKRLTGLEQFSDRFQDAPAVRSLAN
jgi:hypothetical protein